MTIVQVVIVIVIVVVLLMCVLTGLIPMAMARAASRQLKDSSQVRAVMQGLTTWSGSARDSYPLPSKLDAENTTVSEHGEAKDISANIFSILVQNGMAPREGLVSPAEVNRSIRVMKTYEFKLPGRAVNPSKALWDPAFSADFTAARGGNLSYAHIPPTAARLEQWRATWVATEAVVGNRGPEIASMAKGEAPRATPIFARPDSNALLIHGSRNHWEGNIAYNDNHVNFEVRTVGTDASAGWLTVYKDPQGTAWNDCFFYDEPDDASGTNAYLGIFTEAGKTAAEFKAIWD